MLQTLRLHPDSVCSAVHRIEVDVARPRAGCLTLAYLVTGRIGDLAMPAPSIAARTDELWRRTCFEAFIRSSPGAAYYEFNFAPSTQWAAYEFAGYRNGKREAGEIKPPRIAVEASSERFLLQASLELDRTLPAVGGGGGGAEDAPWRLGLSAVIEEANGNQSFWALAHAPGKPDFHHPDSWVLEVG
jgi:hypothetical protein